MSLVDESIYGSSGTKENTSSAKSGRKVPKGRKRVAYRKLVIGLIWLGLFVTLGGSHNYSVVLQPWFATRNIFYR
jgi:lysophospholipid acyltransferase